LFAVACFLPGRAKDVSAPLRRTTLTRKTPTILRINCITATWSTNVSHQMASNPGLRIQLPVTTFTLPYNIDPVRTAQKTVCFLYRLVCLCYITMKWFF